MIIKTRGLVLRYWPYKNTSRIVSWLTPDFGRITTIIKGSQRPRSFFLAQYDLFQTCEIIFYIRNNSQLYLAKECSPLQTRAFLRKDYRASALASYFTDLVYKCSPAGAGCDILFDFINDHLNHLATPPLRSSLLYWFELKLLEVLGLTPHLQHCISCSKRVAPQHGPNFFSNEAGGILCPICSALHPGRCEQIGPDVFATLLAWQRSSSVRSVHTVKHTPHQLRQIRTILGAFILHHLDTPLNSRAIALEVLNLNQPTPARL